MEVTCLLRAPCSRSLHLGPPIRSCTLQPEPQPSLFQETGWLAAAVAANLAGCRGRRRTARLRRYVCRDCLTVSELDKLLVGRASSQRHEWLRQLAHEFESQSGAAGSGAPAELIERIKAAACELEAGLVERSTEARILLLAALCAEHVLFLGPPGTAKSKLARRLLQVAGPEAIYFERLLTRFSVPEELFGPLSLKALENDEYVRRTAGYLPEASIAFVDEIFKANSAILNSLLSIVNERVFDNGPERIHVPLQCLVAASNEAPESEELDALYDRLLFRMVVEQVSDAGLDELVLATTLDSTNRPPSRETQFPISLTDADLARKSAVVVKVPQGVVEILRECRKFLASMEPASVVSDRRLGQAVRMLQVVAWTCGRVVVERADCMLLRHVLWKEPGQSKVFSSWLSKRLARMPGRPMAAILAGLMDRVESGSVELVDLRAELSILRDALSDEILELQRQQRVLKEHCWIAAQEAEALCAAMDLHLDLDRLPQVGARALLLRVAQLDAAAQQCTGAGGKRLLADYVQLCRGRGEFAWSQLAASDPSPADGDETFKLGKHKGHSFSEVARDDRDYCHMVQRKVSEGGFAGQSALDKQIRAFVSFLQMSE